MLEDLAGPLRTAARRYGTPAYVTDLRTLRQAAATVREAFPDPWLTTFSLKANDVAAVVAELAGIGLDANVVSSGEWAVATRAGLPNARITLEGIGKTDADLRAAVRAAARGDPLRWLAIESLDEAGALARLASRLPSGRHLDVLFRLNPEVAPETIAGLAVGAPTSKFGMTADELSEAVQLVDAVPGLVARGVHLHVGSQLRAVDAWRDAARRGLAVVALLRGSLPAFDTLDLGGGFPILPAGEPTPDPARFARELGPLLDAVPADRRPARLAIEPGRALVARAGFLVGRVLHVRDRGAPVGRQVILDVGMTELIRPALYGAHHDVVALTSFGRAVTPGAAGPVLGPDDDRSPARVEGPICESTDHLGEHALPPLRRGDLVAVADAGAYGASLGSTYNGRPRPPQVFVEADGSLRLARPRGRVGSLG
ncbi:MAG TPA: diaminopimelate decarboxylase [Candidatus Acidoferrales bacterium]|jgi:diaminopimelate decarboxylase|nr:diaminopimelate decarboxylase [Candidatus Acidoferrales bacterium]